MKNIFKTFILLTLLCSTWACTSPNMFEEESILVDNEITKIEAVIEPFEIGEGTNARTTITLGEFGKIGTLVWAEGDTIGIYPSQGDQLSFPIVDGVGKTRCEFSGGGWALKGSTETTTYTYSAYSPFNRNYYFQKDNKALPVSMLGQKQIGNNNSSHLGAYDIQLAKGETPTSGTLVFEFKHQASYVRMDITAPCKANWKNITLESNATFTTKATINLSEAIPTISPTLQSNSVSLELENVNTNDSLHIVAYMMMLPVDFTGKNLTMKLTDTDDNVYSAPVTFVNPINAANYLNFAANKARWISAEFEESTGIEEIPYVTFTAEAPQTLTMSKAVETLEYSVNNGEWATLGTTTVAFGGDYGDLKLRGKSSYGTTNYLDPFYVTAFPIVKFGNASSVLCTGDIRTLLDYKNYTSVSTSSARWTYLFKDCYQLKSAPELPATKLASNCYYGMFVNCSNLVSAPKLPAVSLAESCYKRMFSSCANLVEAPLLPATTLAPSCYVEMFSYCTKLTSAPALPATTLAEACYRHMFYGCTKLTSAPALPATILKNRCYSGMFYGCSNLVSAPQLSVIELKDFCYEYMFADCSILKFAPELPATKLFVGCYQCMFLGCSSLTEAPDLPAMALAENCYSSMFSGCTNLSSAPELPANMLYEGCYGGMFNDCSSLTEAPKLPANIMASNCYHGMFAGCTRLINAPVLSATALAPYCYSGMFYGCTSLISTPDLNATSLAEGCYESMFSHCTGLTSTPKLLAETLASYCYAGMFSHCINLRSAPGLPATTLAPGCYGKSGYLYGGMFEGCTNLIEAPKLPATTLAPDCYGRMFYGCSKLNKVTMLATDIGASYCLSDWLYKVSSTGTFTKAAVMESLPTGDSGIPLGWTVVDYTEE